MENLNSATCSLSIMVARTDISFMMQTIPHLVRMCDFPFDRKVLVVDTAPLSGDKVNRPGIGTMEELRECCAKLIRQGVMDEAIDMNYSPEYRRRMYQKHFGTSRLIPTHNYKGYPILGSIFSIEEVPGDFIVHFDSDMLLHQAQGYNWIRAGMEILEKRAEVAFVRPLSGPPSSEGNFFQKYDYSLDPDGFYRFKFFGSRTFLVNRNKLENLLPLPILWRGYRYRWLSKLPSSFLTTLNQVFQRGKLDSWEVMISQKLETTQYIRATLQDPRAWTLHPINRGTEFITYLPRLIERVEAGDFPPEQGGYYDLKLAAWM